MKEPILIIVVVVKQKVYLLWSYHKVKFVCVVIKSIIMIVKIIPKVVTANFLLSLVLRGRSEICALLHNSIYLAGISLFVICDPLAFI